MVCAFPTRRIKQQAVLYHQKRRDPVHVIKNASVLSSKTEGEVTGAVETLTDISAIISRDRQIEGFRRELASLDTFHGIIGNSSGMQKVFDLIISAAHLMHL